MLTLQHIEAEHKRLGELIEQLRQPQFTHNGMVIRLNSGEVYVGTIQCPDRNYHVVLLPGAAESLTWQGAMNWAAGVGGELPDRLESDLLFATLKGQFAKAQYWTREKYASDSDLAWVQHFSDGTRYYSCTKDKSHARAIRRIPL